MSMAVGPPRAVPVIVTLSSDSDSDLSLQGSSQRAGIHTVGGLSRASSEHRSLPNLAQKDSGTASRWPKPTRDGRLARRRQSPCLSDLQDSMEDLGDAAELDSEEGDDTWGFDSMGFEFLAERRGAGIRGQANTSAVPAGRDLVSAGGHKRRRLSQGGIRMSRDDNRACSEGRVMGRHYTWQDRSRESDGGEAHETQSGAEQTNKRAGVACQEVPSSHRTRKGGDAVGDCPGKESEAEEEDSDSECVVLDGDPTADSSKKEGSGEEVDEEMMILGEKGPVACRDFPHARHSCAKFPFGSTPHRDHCPLCHCFVCDSPAPCLVWGDGAQTTDHCHASDRSDKWKLLRKFHKAHAPLLRPPPPPPEPSFHLWPPSGANPTTSASAHRSSRLNLGFSQREQSHVEGSSWARFGGPARDRPSVPEGRGGASPATVQGEAWANMEGGPCFSLGLSFSLESNSAPSGLLGVGREDRGAVGRRGPEARTLDGQAQSTAPQHQAALGQRSGRPGGSAARSGSGRRDRGGELATAGRHVRFEEVDSLVVGEPAAGRMGALWNAPRGGIERGEKEVGTTQGTSCGQAAAANGVVPSGEAGDLITVLESCDEGGTGEGLILFERQTDKVSGESKLEELGAESSLAASLRPSPESAQNGRGLGDFWTGDRVGSGSGAGAAGGGASCAPTYEWAAARIGHGGSAEAEADHDGGGQWRAAQTLLQPPPAMALATSQQLLPYSYQSAAAMPASSLSVHLACRTAGDTDSSFAPRPLLASLTHAPRSELGPNTGPTSSPNHNPNPSPSPIVFGFSLAAAPPDPLPSPPASSPSPPPPLPPGSPPQSPSSSPAASSHPPLLEPSPAWPASWTIPPSSGPATTLEAHQFSRGSWAPEGDLQETGTFPPTGWVLDTSVPPPISSQPSGSAPHPCPTSGGHHSPAGRPQAGPQATQATREADIVPSEPNPWHATSELDTWHTSLYQYHYLQALVGGAHGHVGIQQSQPDTTIPVPYQAQGSHPPLWTVPDPSVAQMAPVPDGPSVSSLQSGWQSAAWHFRHCAPVPQQPVSAPSWTNHGPPSGAQHGYAQGSNGKGLAVPPHQQGWSWQWEGPHGHSASGRGQAGQHLGAGQEGWWGEGGGVAQRYGGWSGSLYQGTEETKQSPPSSQEAWGAWRAQASNGTW